MTTHTVPANPRIELARTRRMLEDTALNAVSGTLVALRPDLGSPDRWTAEVRSPDGEHLTLRLDRSLQTVEVVPPGAIARAA
ncbi:MAG: hypothetical protein JWO90_733 [Solirubrobacterales bacterium]|jgi:hypothetical protein|nr:hypothetical protein [Solirubrobacterales bacterium]